jgi:hypothetical protein
VRSLCKPPSLVRRFWPLPLALAICVSGCARWNALRDQVRGKGYSDETADWSKGLRTPSSSSGSSQLFGVDERARQIEANLGYR